MSIQYRARMRSVVDYTSNDESSDQGFCCLPPDHENYEDSPVASSYNDCIFVGGYFQQTSGECPDLGIQSCCCACDYVDDFDAFLENPGPNYGDGCPNGNNAECYQGGLKETTFCECNDVGGIWAGTYSDGTGVPCSVYSESSHNLCDPDGSGPVKDIRFPGGCCFTYVVDEVENTRCENVCSAQACVTTANEIAEEEGGTLIDDSLIYNPQDDCDNVDCLYQMGYSGSEENRSRNNRDARTGILVGNKMSFTERNPRSSCIYKKNEVTVCSLETEDSCKDKNGIYIGLDKNSLTLDCSSTEANEIKDYFSNDKEKISSSIVNTWNLGDKVLNAGIYMGIFSLNGSICYGNRDTGESVHYPATEDDGISYPDYAIIMYPENIRGVYDNNLKVTHPQRNNTDYNLDFRTSFWNSIENNEINKNLKLTKTVNDLGHYNWYIPSLDVFSFIKNQMTEHRNTIINNINKSENHNLKYSDLSNDQYYGTSTIINDGKNPPRFYSYGHNGNYVSLFKMHEGILRWRPVLMLEIV
tara:strand:+ start:1586 stop:3169 length:1584 start_codon:yes stop_codon:yes gene_type:complete